MITVPVGFASGFKSADGRAWIAELPGLVERYAQRWHLERDGELMHGYVGLIVPVRTADAASAVLKLSWPHDEALDEAVALGAWNGRGAVRLLDHDAESYVLLLERLDPARSLNTEPIEEAVTIAGGLLRRLAVAGPPLHRSLSEVAERWQQELPADAARLGNTVPTRVVDEAVARCRELAPDIGSVIVNEDLHFENVLRGIREPWLVIDPKVLSGDPEFGVIPLLRNRFDEMDGPGDLRTRFDGAVDAAELDPERARAWTFTRAVDDWLYFLGEDNAVGVRAATAIAESLRSGRHPF